MSKSPTKPRPKYVQALDLIGNSDLDRGCKDLLRVMLRWVNLSPDSGELWPSIPTMAWYASMTDTGIRKIIRRLIEAGVVTVVLATKGGRRPSGVGNTTVYKMHFGALRARSRSKRTPNVVEGSTQGLSSPDNGDSPAPNGDSATPHPVPPNPLPSSAKASMHDASEVSQEGASAGTDPLPLDGCMDGSGAPAPRSVREYLIEAGVRGENLERLSSVANVTIEAIAEEFAAVAKDSRVRNRAAVLVRRLSQRFGVELKKSARLSSGDLDAVTRIENLRRRRTTDG